MKCSRCGESIPVNAAFCPQCGAKVEAPETGKQTSTAPSRTARLGACAHSLSDRLGVLIKRARPIVRRCFVFIGNSIGSFYARLGGLYMRTKPIIKRFWGRRAFRMGVIAVVILFVAIIGIRLLFGGKNGEPETSRKDVSLSSSSGPSASETLDEFFRLLESLDSEDHYQLENYIRFPTKSETREALGAEKAEEFEEKTVKMLKVMLRSGTISLAWNEVQMRALPASANLTTLEEKKGKDGVVWVNVAIAVNGIVMDEEQSFPLPMRKEQGKWKIDLLCIWKAGEDGTLADWMNFFHDE